MNEMSVKIQAVRAPASNEEIRAAQNKVIERLSADPIAACTTITTTGHVGDGLACTVQQGKFSTITDMGPAMGGSALGPSPGFYGRAAVIGCVAIAVKMTAAREGLQVSSVDVTIETDFDDLAIFGMGSGNAAPAETRIKLAVGTTEPAGVIDDLVQRVLVYDPWFLALRDAQSVVVDTHIAR